MEKLFVFKAVAREGKLQLCVSIKGRSAEGRSYRVINTNHPDLSTLGKEGTFVGRSSLAISANSYINSTISIARSIVEERQPESIKEFLAIYDCGTESPDTLGDIAEKYMNSLRYPTNGKQPSNGWKNVQTLINKLKYLGYDKLPLSRVDNAFYEKFCDTIRNGKARSCENKTDRGGHGYTGSVALLKTILNKAYRDKLIGNEITYNWASGDRIPILDESNPMSRMNVPTEEEWEKFLRVDLRRYTWSNRDIHRLELMRSVIIVLVESLSRPIDVISMRSDDISNMSWEYVPAKFKQMPTAFKRKIRKPIGLTKMAYNAIMRNKGKTNSGYVFPFACNMEEHTDNEKYMMSINGVESKMNQWLKLLTNSVFSKDMSLYSFRHFAITRAINKGMNVASVATLAKTSIQQINKTYYERDGVSSMAKLEALLNSNPQVE